MTVVGVCTSSCSVHALTALPSVQLIQGHCTDILPSVSHPLSSIRLIQVRVKVCSSVCVEVKEVQTAVLAANQRNRSHMAALQISLYLHGKGVWIGAIINVMDQLRLKHILSAASFTRNASHISSRVPGAWATDVTCSPVCLEEGLSLGT